MKDMLVATKAGELEGGRANKSKVCAKVPSALCNSMSTLIHSSSLVTRHICLSLPAALVICGFARIAAATEPWADSHLPVKDGLVLWLDASSQKAARLSRQLPSLVDGAAVDVWFDGSGRDCHLSQAVEASRPHLRVEGANAAVAFDGKDDFLSASNVRLGFSNATLFVHAAPLSNAGGFRGFLAMNAFGRNDYTSGLNVDLGPAGSAAFSLLNIEGAGLGGVLNLLKGQRPFGVFHTLAMTTETGPGGIRLFVDGEAGGVRERKPGVLRMDDLTIGARRYSNTPNVPPFVQGFLEGEIAEVLLYDRLLDDRERSEVQKYLSTKYASLKVAAIDPARQPLETVTNPPPVQMLV